MYLRSPREGSNQSLAVQALSDHLLCGRLPCAARHACHRAASRTASPLTPLQCAVCTTTGHYARKLRPTLPRPSSPPPSIKPASSASMSSTTTQRVLTGPSSPGPRLSLRPPNQALASFDPPKEGADGAIAAAYEAYARAETSR